MTYTRNTISTHAHEKPRLKILLAEDEYDLRVLYAKYLDSLGFSVTSCVDGKEALKIYLEHQFEFDVLLTDYRMPHLSGAELIRSIQSVSQTPIHFIINTASVEPEALTLKKQGVIDEILIKPIRLDVLEKALIKLE